MAVRVLIVDDSRFYRKRIADILASDSRIEVAGEAHDGREALELVEKLRPDVVTMDIEMPVMDGIAAVKAIMKTAPLPILMLSSLTTEGAQATLDALSSGAVDFMAKPGEDLDRNFSRTLCAKIRILAARAAVARSVAAPTPQTRTAGTRDRDMAALRNADLVVIGASTGGPVAVHEILGAIAPEIKAPIVVVQHMPAAFTGAYAERLNRHSNRSVIHASADAALQQRHIYIVSGGKQISFKQEGRALCYRIQDPDDNQTYKPCIDTALHSLLDVDGMHILVIILTGMGADGRDGVVDLHRKGATIWAQDESSSVIYGMPHAVAESGAADSILSLHEMKKYISGDR